MERTVKKKEEHTGHYETEKTQIMYALINNSTHFYKHCVHKLDPKPEGKGKNKPQ